MDPYEILGVPSTVGDEELKRAYHALVRRHHPDRFAGDPVRQELANRKMREINEAYDRVTAARTRGEPVTPPPPPPPPPRKGGAETRRGQWSASDFGTAAGRPFAGYPYVRTLIAAGGFAAAYGELLHVATSDRKAEWHYLAGLSHRGLHHLHDALREVSLACRLDPKNKEYRTTRDEMRHRADAFGERAGAQKGAAPKKRGSFCKECCFRLLGMDDGKC